MFWARFSEFLFGNSVWECFTGVVRTPLSAEGFKMGDFADVGLAIPRLLNISNPNVIELKSCVEQPGTLGLVAGFY